MEFGEKMRALREREGMTQQTLADQLYVTRQAVSRWECGARYPDLLMTKKIADIFGVSMDELVSGEEVKRDMEKEKLLAEPLAGNVQTMLYAVTFILYLVNAFLSLVLFFWAQGNTEYVQEIYLNISGLTSWIGKTLLLGCGLYFAVTGRLNAKRTGRLMVTFFTLNMLCSIANGVFTEQYFIWWLNAILIGAETAIVYFFFRSKNPVAPAGIYLITGIQFWNVLKLAAKLIRETATLEVMSVSVIRMLEMISFGVLLLYQAYELNRKRKKVAG